MPRRQAPWARPWTLLLTLTLLGGGLFGMTALLWNKMVTGPAPTPTERVALHPVTTQAVALSAVAGASAVPAQHDPPAEAVFQIPGQDPMAPAVKTPFQTTVNALAMVSSSDLYRMDPLEPVSGLGGPLLGGSLGDGTGDGMSVPKIDPVDLLRFTGLVDGRAGKKVAVLKVDGDEGPKTYVKRLGDTFTVGSSQVKLLKVNGYELSMSVNGASRRLMLEPLTESRSSAASKSMASSSNTPETPSAPASSEKEKAETELMKGLAE